MKLIIFLGNAGMEYEKNRHNLGFMIGDFYAEQQGAKWKFEKKFGAEIAKISLDSPIQSANDRAVLLVKPQLFYNRTGEVIAKIANFYKIDADDILAVCDDFNLNFGKIRYRKQGSDGGNNGLKSLVAHIGEKFARIRIGTDSPLRQQIGETDFVLSNFTAQESKNLPNICAEVSKIIDEFIES